MSKRVTIMVDDDNDRKLRNKQAKLIQSDQSSWSYSKVVNMAIKKGLT